MRLNLWLLSSQQNPSVGQEPPDSLISFTRLPHQRASSPRGIRRAYRLQPDIRLMTCFGSGQLKRPLLNFSHISVAHVCFPSKPLLKSRDYPNPNVMNYPCFFRPGLSKTVVMNKTFQTHLQSPLGGIVVVFLCIFRGDLLKLSQASLHASY